MVVRQTTAEVCGLMQTAWRQPASWRGQQKGCRRCSGCCCPGQSSHCGSALIPFKTPAFRGDKHSRWEAVNYDRCHTQCTKMQTVILTFSIFEALRKQFVMAWLWLPPQKNSLKANHSCLQCNKAKPKYLHNQIAYKRLSKGHSNKHN